MSEWPIRQQSAHGYPKATWDMERTCCRCGASFLGLAPGATGERGIWIANWWWVCSQECADAEVSGPRVSSATARPANSTLGPKGWRHTPSVESE